MNQEPIGLLGDEYFYTSAPNVMIWIDILDWFKFKISAKKIKYTLKKDLKLDGAKIEIARVGGAKHGHIRIPCPSCEPLLAAFKINL